MFEGIRRGVSVRNPVDRSAGRVRRARLTSASSILAQGIAFVVGLVSVPLTVSYLGPERYGMWITLSSFLTWLTLADLGLGGNGLINTLADANGRDDRQLGREMVATAFWSLAGIAGVFVIGGALALPFVPLEVLFRPSAHGVMSELQWAVGLAFGSWFLALPLNTVTAVFYGYQEGYLSNTWAVVGSLASLLALVVVTHIHGGLVELVLALCGSAAGLALALSTGAQAADKKTLVFVVNGASDFWKEAEAGVKKAQTELPNYTLQFKYPEQAAAAIQQRLMDDLVAAGVSAIMVSAVDPKTSTEALNRIGSQIPLFTTDSDAPQTNRIAYIGSSNTDAGKQAGSLMLKALPNGGKCIGFVGLLEADNARERIEGVKQAIAGSKVELRVGTVRIARPKNGLVDGLPEAIELNLVEVREIEPPPGKSALLWRLLTTHTVANAAQANEIVQLYRLRWRIEQTFRALKSDGLALEDSQVIDAERMFNLAAIGLAAAVRTIQLVDARDGSPRPASDVVDDAFMPALESISKKLEGKTMRQKNHHPIGSLAFVAWIAARLGGWNCYYKPPGPKTMRDGWDQLAARLEGYALAMQHINP
jgi:hypothetical protein